MHPEPLKSNSPSILIIEADAAARSTLQKILSRRGLRVYCTADIDSASNVLENCRIDLVLTELFDGNRVRQALAVAIQQRERGDLQPSYIPVVAMSQKGMWEDLSIFSAADAVRAAAVLRKPFTAAHLLRLLHPLLPTGSLGEANSLPLAAQPELCSRDTEIRWHAGRSC